MNNIIKLDFQGSPISFDTDGWINATEAAAKFGKKPAKWLELPSTQSYIEVLSKALGFQSKVRKSDIGIESKAGLSLFGLVRTIRGGITPGTWLHPKLAVPFARWCSDEFAVQCDLYIDSILFGNGHALEQFKHACADLEAAKKIASQSGKTLAIFRWQKPDLINAVGYWQEQLKLPLIMLA